MSERKRGLPIGAYTSQPLGNFVLNGIDRMVKERLKVKCMHRYCDDCVMLVKTKAEALQVLQAYNAAVAELGMEVKATSLYAPLDRKRKRRKRQRGKRKRY